MPERWDDMNANLTLVLLVIDRLEVLSLGWAVQPAIQLLCKRDVLDL